MPNSTAFLMLTIWPLVTLVLFVKLPPGRALLATIIGGYLLLPPAPTALDFPLLPPLNKETLPLVSALMVYLFLSNRDQVPLTMAELYRGAATAIIAFPMVAWNILVHLKDALTLPQSPVGKALFAMFVLGPIPTVLTNPEPLIFQITAIRGLYPFDAIALTIIQFMVLIGFLMARKFLRSEADQRDLMLAFMIGGLVYTLPVLIEVRLSPQINTWVYGYFQHSFEQSIRAGGFRPIVFLNHGIWVAFFIMTALIATVALTRANRLGHRRIFGLIALLFMGLLVLSKTLASLLFAAVLVPMVWLLTPRRQIALALLMGSVAFAYPVLKSIDAVPTDFLLSQAEAVSPDRAASLKFRFDQEDLLFERALEKPVFGWGSWGRNQLRNPVNGQIESVSDGRWVIIIGMFGWIGFIAEFGLLLLPIFLIWQETRKRPDLEISPYLGPLCLLLGANMIDLLPNATLTPITWLIAGTLLGHAEKLRARRDEREQTIAAETAAINVGARPIL